MAIRKKWQDLTITDDYMFKQVMKHPRICKRLIEAVLKIKVRDIRYMEDEKSFKNSYVGKGIRLDVYVEDADNSRFLLEMQVRDYGAEEIAKRSRYYQATIDFDFLLAGQPYKKLGEAYIIFFCPFSLFGGDRRMYTFENTCREEKTLTLGDGMTKVFLSSAGQKTDDLAPDVAAFLDYMNGYLDNNDFVQDIDNEIRQMKADGAKEAGYMTYQMKLDEEREEGREEGRLDIVLGMFKAGLPLDQIAVIANRSSDEVLALRQKFVAEGALPC